jgi:hypothetical protein
MREKEFTHQHEQNPQTWQSHKTGGQQAAMARRSKV